MRPGRGGFSGGRWGILLVLVASITVHLVIFGNALDPDGATFLQMASNVVNRGTLEPGTVLVARHPPLMALMLVPLGLVFGFTEFSLHMLELIFLTFDVLVLQVFGRGLGSRFALIPSALLSVDPVLFLNMSEGRTVAPLILFTLITLWGVWRGIRDSRWLVVAALGASLGFLTADSIGYLVVLAGAVGLLWRFHYVRWAVFRDRGYLIAIGFFLAIFLAWSVYNLATIGSPYTDPRVVRYLSLFFTTLPAFVPIFTAGGLAVYFLLFVSQAGLVFLLLPEGRRALARLPRQVLADQRLGALCLFIATGTVIASLLGASFLLFEPGRSAFDVDSYLRYVDVVAPLAYLAVAIHVRNVARSSRPYRWVVPLGLVVVLLVAQSIPKIEQGLGNSAYFVPVEDALRARGASVVYSDEAVWLRYNLPGITFIQVDKGYETRYVNLTASDVPVGAVLLTAIYIPPRYDLRIERFYLVDHFDPGLNSPLLNGFYGG